MIASRITGIGAYVPPQVVTNKDLEQMLDTTHDWIVQRTGIEERRWATDEVSTSDLGVHASLQAIADAGIKKEDIDMIVVATQMPDHDAPGAGAFLQAKLGLSGIPVFEMRQACSGFIFAIDLADKYIRTQTAKCILVVGAELQSKTMDKTPNGRAVSVIFADGAGAVIIQPTEVKDPSKDPHIISTCVHTDGAFAKELWIESPGTAKIGPSRVTAEDLAAGKHHLQMNGRYVFTHAVKRMPEVLQEACDKAHFKVDDVDMFFFHQANMRINEKVAVDMNIPAEKVHNTIQKFGNTTSATIPLGMRDAKDAGLLKPGMLIGMAAFGAGFTWGGAVIRL